MKDLLARVAFIEALNSRWVEDKMQEKEWATLKHALLTVMKLEAMHTSC